MILKKDPNWDLHYVFERAVSQEKKSYSKKILDQFDEHDFLSMPIVLDLVAAERLLLLKFLYKKGIPLTHKDTPFGNGLHVACAVTGSLSCVKFFVENNILTDIHEKCARDGHTPLTLTIYFKNHDILEYFKEKFGITCVSFEDVQVYFTRNETSSQ